MEGNIEYAKNLDHNVHVIASLSLSAATISLDWNSPVACALASTITPHNKLNY